MSEERHGWERLAGLLVARRTQLGPQYKNRLKFASDTGLNERLISDLENARRHKYRDTTLRAVEVAYRWASGSIDRVLQGDSPVEQTPPMGFRTHSAFPGMAASQGGTATVAAPPQVASWFANDLARRGLDAATLTLTEIRELAAYHGYTLGELLVNAGLATEEELEIAERPTAHRRALAEYDMAVKQILASPRLSARERQEVQALADKARQDALGGQSGD